MSEVAKTLPDPLETTTVDPGPNADEILSQLAGEEIDRLLAEADAPRSQPVVAIAPTPPVPVAAVPPVPAAPAMVAKETGTFRTTRKAPPPDAAAESDLSKQLDDLFNELNQETVAPPVQPTLPDLPAPEVLPQVQVEQPKPVAIEAPRPVTTDPAEETTSLEENVLAATELAVTEMAATEMAATERAAAERAAKELAAASVSDVRVETLDVVPTSPAKERRTREPLISLVLRPVAKLSSRFPETMLDWMGKVAILTTVNAMAIFAYLLIRRH